MTNFFHIIKEEVKPKEVKKWSHEEDDEDEVDVDEDDVDANGVNGDDGDGELDPLDAYMSEVSKEVRKMKGGLGLDTKNSKSMELYQILKVILPKLTSTTVKERTSYYVWSG